MTQSAHIIIFGNTVRGSGKSLTAAQLAVALLRAGHRIGTIDLDEDDEGLSLFLHRRRDHDADLPQPLHRRLPAAGRDDTALENALTLAITDLSTACDFIIIDTPHGDQTLAKLAHAYADTLITPLREDTLSALATLKSNTARIETVTPYAEMVEDQNIRRLDRGAAPSTGWSCAPAYSTNPSATNANPLTCLINSALNSAFNRFKGYMNVPSIKTCLHKDSPCST